MKSQTKSPGPTIKQASLAIVILFVLAAGVVLLIWSLQERDSQQYQQQASDTQSLNACLHSAWPSVPKLEHHLAEFAFYVPKA